MDAAASNQRGSGLGDGSEGSADEARRPPTSRAVPASTRTKTSRRERMGVEVDIVRSLLLPRPRRQRRAAFKAFLGPELRGPVVLRHRRRARRKDDPWLLGFSVDVDVRRQAIGLVERSDPYEADGIAGAGVVAPDGNAAPGAARDLLPLAAVGGRVDDFHLSGEKLNAISFDERVQGERRTCFALAPTAVAAVDE